MNPVYPVVGASKDPASPNTVGPDRGIAIVANDKVMHWLLPFLESWKATNAALPLFLIPYDDNVEMTRRVAAIYGVSFTEVDSAALDALAKRLYPFGWNKRNRLRKLLSLTLPLDEVIFLDVDIILFRDLREVLGFLEPGVTDFIVIAKTDDYVYNAHAKDYDYLRDATLFNDGFFVTSNKILTIDDFLDAMREDEKVFHRVRQRGGLYAQPLTNFVAHRKRLKIVTVSHLLPGASPQSYHKAEGVTFGPDGPLDVEGERIYFCHWPGVSRPSNLAFDGAWHVLAEQAAARVKAAGGI